MGVWSDQLLPRFVDKACGTRDVMVRRATTTAGLDGVIVEIGFGSGLNLVSLPSEVSRVYAVDPAVVGRKLAAGRVANATAAVDYVGLDGQDLPLDDESCDGALSTFTLCTVPDPERALAELHRVLRPGGRFHFLEHGLSPDAKVAKGQRRFDPVQGRLFGGCQLSRDTRGLVEAAGFELTEVEAGYVKGPKILSWFTRGIARK